MTQVKTPSILTSRYTASAVATATTAEVKITRLSELSDVVVIVATAHSSAQTATVQRQISQNTANNFVMGSAVLGSGVVAQQIIDTNQKLLLLPNDKVVINYPNAQNSTFTVYVTLKEYL